MEREMIGYEKIDKKCTKKVWMKVETENHVFSDRDMLFI